MMKNFLFAVLLTLGPLGMMGCSDDDDPPPVAGGRTADIEGIWIGAINTNQLSAPTTAGMVLAQLATDVAGTYTAAGTSGSVDGTVSGNTFTFTLVKTSSCTGTFQGVATIANDQNMTFTVFTGSDCAGAHTGTGALTKQ